MVALNSRVLAGLGIRVLTVYDALNDNRNVESSVRSAHEAGMPVNTMMTYTLSPVTPTRTTSSARASCAH